METNFETFAKNLNREEIDLIDKLGNMTDNEISDELAEYIANSPNLMEKIESIIKKEIYKYKDFIEEETEKLWEDEIIDDEYDYSGGLYNCDELYVIAILKAIGILWLPHDANLKI